MSESCVYCLEFDNVVDKIDFATYDPEKIRFFNILKRKGAIPLEECAISVEETIEPKQNPETLFNYLGLENIESNTGRAHFQQLSGREIYSKAKIFREGDIVFARLRPYLNKAHLVKIENAIGSTELYVIRPKEGILIEYLLRYLLSNLTLRQTKAMTGSALPRLDETDFLNLLIIIPENQEAIMSKVEKFDSKIMQIEKETISKFEEINALFLEKYNIKFPDMSINYYDTNSDVVSDRLDFIWHNPKILNILKQLDENESIILEDLTETEIVYGINDYGREERAIPFINIENLSLDGRIHAESIRYVDACKKEKLLQKGDILISRSRGAGVSGLITEREENFTFGSYVLRIRILADSEVDPLYLVYYLNSPLGQIQVRRLETGSSGCNINPQQLKQIKVLVDRDTVKDITKQIKANLKTIKEYDVMKKELTRKSDKLFESLVLR